MNVSLNDKIEFVTEYFGECVKLVSTQNDSTRMVLQNMDSVDITDTKCISSYKIANINETADVSVDFRNYILEKYIDRGEKHNCRIFCRACIDVLDEEQRVLSEKILDNGYGALDKAMLRDRLQDINTQRVRMNEFAKSEICFEK